MLFNIKHKFSGAVLFALETDSLKLCVQAAVKSKAYLRDAYLRGADLRGADLRGADLRDADLSGADLRDADLSGAKFDIPPASDEQAIKNLDQVRALILEDRKLLNMSHWHDDDSKWQEHTCAEEAVCGTTHCLAGWLQVCSTDEKIRKLDPALAGTLLAPVAAKMFYSNEATVVKWLKDREYAGEKAWNRLGCSSVGGRASTSAGNSSVKTFSGTMRGSLSALAVVVKLATSRSRVRPLKAIPAPLPMGRCRSGRRV